MLPLLSHQVRPTPMLRIRRFLNRPPSYFSDPDNAPAPFVPPAGQNTASNVKSPDLERLAEKERELDELRESMRASSAKPLFDFTSIAFTMLLGYFAYDNYKGRLKLEKVVKDTNALSAKALQQQLREFAEARQRHLVAMMKLTRAQNRVMLKMSIHIAMLRKQLEEAGLEPAQIDKVVEEFQSSVRVLMVNGNETLWLDDASPYKQYLPSVRDYVAKPKVDTDLE